MSRSLPADLVQAQAAWHRTYTSLARLPAGASTTAHRCRLISLSCQIAAHPYWADPRHSPAARVDLIRQARASQWGTVA